MARGSVAFCCAKRAGAFPESAIDGRAMTIDETARVALRLITIPTGIFFLAMGAN
jgi:hypothetical protein